MIKLPIYYKSITLTTTASGGTTEAYGDPVIDYAYVEDVSEDKVNSTIVTGQANVKRFTVDYRASLAITNKWLIVFEGVTYTILTIKTDKYNKLKYIIEAKAKV